jgi:hypothetical protein
LGLYPNPFAERLTIYFSLRVGADLILDVFDVAGEPLWSYRVPVGAGKNVLTWDGVNGTGARCASGVYLLKLRARGLDGTSDQYWSQAVISR